jgi:hypothetical protein
MSDQYDATTGAVTLTWHTIANNIQYCPRHPARPVVQPAILSIIGGHRFGHA